MKHLQKPQSGTEMVSLKSSVQRVQVIAIKELETSIISDSWFYTRARAGFFYTENFTDRTIDPKVRRGIFRA